MHAYNTTSYFLKTLYLYFVNPYTLHGCHKKVIFFISLIAYVYKGTRYSYKLKLKIICILNAYMFVWLQQHFTF